MKRSVNLVSFVGLILISTLSGRSVTAGIITVWNFNSVSVDGSTLTGTLSPSAGVGIASLVGSIDGSFGNGAADGGSSDSAAGDNSAWHTNKYAAQGVGDRQSGVQFLVSTSGYSDIRLAWDQRNSNTASRFWGIDYTVNGTDWLQLADTYASTAGSTWYNGRTADFSGIASTSDNSLFGVRIVAIFEPGMSEYAATNAASSYSTSGTSRFDMVRISGTPLGATAVPEPSTFAAWVAILTCCAAGNFLGRIGNVLQRNRARKNNNATTC